MLNAIAPISAVLNISHKDCFDGLVSAWVVHKWALKKAYSYEVHYANYPDQLPDLAMFVGKIVVITDFSYPLDFIVKISKVAKRLMMFDHHASAKINFIDIDIGMFDCPTDILFDDQHSGAGLAWSHLYENHEVPAIVRCAEDHDLWRFNYKDTKPIMAYLGMLGLSFASVDWVHQNHDEAVKAGQLLVDKDDQMVEWHLKNVQYFHVAGLKDILPVPIVNAPRYIASKVAERLTDEYPLVIMYEDYANSRKGSLRSSKSWNTDCTIFAAMFGGSGNPTASGCQFQRGTPVSAQLLMKPKFVVEYLKLKKVEA